jgi:3,4-dihydroxy 2-butanone 4-phosphate synthase
VFIIKNICIKLFTIKLVDTYILVIKRRLVMTIEEAVEKLKSGTFVVIYDGDDREGEADLVIHAKNAKPESIERLRRDAGGLICLSLDAESSNRLKLPFYTDILEASEYEISKMSCSKTAYKDKPAFAIAVNSKKVYTGITDNDRSLTIKSIAELNEREGNIHEEFMSDFYSPGHIFLLIGRGIENRKGHTELTLELARRAELSGAMVLCEMLGMGKALSKDEARAYAEENGFGFCEGRDF